MNTAEAFNACTVEGNVVKLPAQQLERSVYLEVAKALKLIGGKWKGGKVFGFVFPGDPTELLLKIQGGDKVNLKKEYQFFATPPALAERLVELADFYSYDKILEPSAGQGAIVKAICSTGYRGKVDCYELMEANRMILSEIPSANIIGNDFLAAPVLKLYNCIIANPPFSKNQDIQHVRKMVNLLLPGGRLVTLMSKHWITSENRVEKEFKTWLDGFYMELIEVEAGAFKESGTNVAAVILIINK